MKNIVILVGDVFIYSSFLLYTVFLLLAINVLLPCQYLHLEGSIKVVLLNRLRKVSFSHLSIIENNFILYRKPVLFSISLFTLEISFFVISTNPHFSEDFTFWCIILCIVEIISPSLTCRNSSATFFSFRLQLAGFEYFYFLFLHMQAISFHQL